MTDYSHLISQYREIEHDHDFDVQLTALHDDWFRAEEFIDGAMWLLGRAPEEGKHIHGDIWFLPVTTIEGFPTACIYYSFTDRIVRLRSILISEPATGAIEESA